ncbi:mechanosensitive ion channel protein MscS [Clostridia bacterium]|nr:mechanosensitive ion channel protein MscS [Clostridia bacterium]
MLFFQEVPTPTPTDTVDQIKTVTENVSNGQLSDYVHQYAPGLIHFGIDVLFALLIYFVGSKIIQLIRRFLRHALVKAGAEAGVRQFLLSLAGALLYFFLIIIIATQFGLKTTSVAAIIGSMGLAIGLAAQGSLSNFAGGVLILVVKPFKVGDYIIEDNRKNEGVVKEIQLFYTKLVTPDNRVIVIPNGSLSNNSLTNLTYQEKRRIDVIVSVSYQENLSRVKDLLSHIANTEELRLPGEEIELFVSELRENSVEIGCRIWVKTANYALVKSRMLEEIVLQFSKQKIKMPMQRLWLNENHGGE